MKTGLLNLVGSGADFSAIVSSVWRSRLCPGQGASTPPAAP